MSLEKLVAKYVASAEHVLREIEISGSDVIVDGKSVKRVVEHAKAYLEDAKYYMDKKRFEVSLASIGYCEGLLDALRLLGAVRFEWLTEKRQRNHE